MRIKLSDIVEAIDRTNVEERFYLNYKNGRIWCCSDNAGNYYIDNLEKLDDDILFDDSSISIPTYIEINEYRIMKDFVSYIKDDKIKEQLLIVIQGTGAFRRFKDSCINFQIINEWYEYRNKEYFEIAKEWCIHNNIDFEE